MRASMRACAWVVLSVAIGWLPMAVHAQECDAQAMVGTFNAGRMPDMTNCPRDRAEKILHVTEHRYTVEPGTSNHVQPGTVFRQDPSPETEVQVSTPVTIWVSTGPEPEDRSVDVRVREVADADDTVFHFRVENIGTSTASGVVLTVAGTNATPIGPPGFCKDWPCGIPSLVQGQGRDVVLRASPEAQGAFGVTLEASVDGDVDLANNRSQVTHAAATPGVSATTNVPPSTATSAGPATPGSRIGPASAATSTAIPPSSSATKAIRPPSTASVVRQPPPPPRTGAMPPSTQTAPPSSIPWWWIPIGLGGCAAAYGVVRMLRPKPIRPMPAPPTHAGPPESPADWIPRVKAHARPPVTRDASPIGEVPLAAPPISVTTTRAWRDAVPLGEIDAWKKEARQ